MQMRSRFGIATGSAQTKIGCKKEDKLRMEPIKRNASMLAVRNMEVNSKYGTATVYPSSGFPIWIDGISTDNMLVSSLCRASVFTFQMETRKMVTLLNSTLAIAFTGISTAMTRSHVENATVLFGVLPRQSRVVSPPTSHSLSLCELLQYIASPPKKE